VTAAKGHILCVASNYPRWKGDSTTPFVHNLAVDLMGLGWNVTVLAPHAPGCKRAEVLDGLRVKRFRYLWPESLQTVCYQGGMMINLRKRPLEFLKIPIFILLETWNIVRELRGGHYDLVHSHCIIPQGFTCGVARLVCSTPHVTTVHGSDVFALNSPLFRPFKRFAVHQANAVTVNSSVTRQALLDLAPNTKNLHIIPMGANLPSSFEDTDLHSAALRNRFSGKRPLLLFVGRLIEEKGIADLLQAMTTIRRDFPDAHLVLVGEGQDREKFHQMTRKLGIADNVTFAGWVDTQDIVKYYKIADMFIGPSRPNKAGGGEAQGLTFVEAMLTGTPVIATRVGGIVDAVIHEETGLLVAPHAPQEIAAAVSRLWRHPDLTKKLRQQARKMAQERFTRLASARAFSGLFQQVLSRWHIQRSGKPK